MRDRKKAQDLEARMADFERKLREEMEREVSVGAGR